MSWIDYEIEQAKKNKKADFSVRTRDKRVIDRMEQLAYPDDEVDPIEELRSEGDENNCVQLH